MVEPLDQRLPGRLLDEVDGLTDPSEPREIVDPAQHGHDDQDDDHDSGDEEDDPSALAVHTGAQRHDADEAEQEGAYESAERIVGGGVVAQQLGGPRSHVAGHRGVGGDHGRQ